MAKKAPRAAERTTWTISSKESRKAGKRNFSGKKKGKNKKAKGK